MCDLPDNSLRLSSTIDSQLLSIRPACFRAHSIGFTVKAHSNVSKIAAESTDSVTINQIIEIQYIEVSVLLCK